MTELKPPRDGMLDWDTQPHCSLITKPKNGLLLPAETIAIKMATMASYLNPSCHAKGQVVEEHCDRMQLDKQVTKGLRCAWLAGVQLDNQTCTLIKEL